MAFDYHMDFSLLIHLVDSFLFFSLKKKLCKFSMSPYSPMALRNLFYYLCQIGLRTREICIQES